MARSDVTSPHGRCVILELDDTELAAALAALPAGERVHAEALPPIRRRDFILGRTALRALVGEAPPPILSDARGAPALPAEWAGSISHKGHRAAAIAAAATGAHLGIDLERAVAPKLDIARKILTPNEHATGPDVTLYFAIKEAIYKAVDPFVHRYVGFAEVELAVGAGGACTVSVVDPARLPVSIEAWWCEHEGHWLATAWAIARPAPR